MDRKKPSARQPGGLRSPAEEPRPEALLAGQNKALEMIAGDAPLAAVLDYLTRFIESQAADLFCSVLLLEGDRLRLGAAPSLPDVYNRAVDDVVIGPAVGSCGTVAFTGRAVVVTDIATDPRWTPFPEAAKLALDAGLRACWSTPILAASGGVLGTFAMYSRAPSEPRPWHLRLVEIATHIAGIAIERHRAGRALAERAERLAEADRRKDELLAILGHELRNPLSPIVTALGLMRAHEGDPEAVARHRVVVERQVRHLSRLVDLFVQADPSHRQALAGLGIGLALVKRLVELHGGEVALTSEGEGRGTEVTVRLPAAAPGTSQRAPPPAAPAAGSKSRRVLVVDDNFDAADLLAEALREVGHEVRVEHDGQSAVTTADAWQPDVALVDIGLPGMDGYAVARHLRVTRPKGALRLVALTGYGQESDQRRAMDAGFDAHLVKPADLDRIAALIAA